MRLMAKVGFVGLGWDLAREQKLVAVVFSIWIRYLLSYGSSKSMKKL